MSRAVSSVVAQISSGRGGEKQQRQYEQEEKQGRTLMMHTTLTNATCTVYVLDAVYPCSVCRGARLQQEDTDVT